MACLKCGKPFVGENSGHRICPRCEISNLGLSKLMSESPVHINYSDLGINDEPNSGRRIMRKMLGVTH